jgi:hypothetical protein
MPVVLRKEGYRFEFYASDGPERPHVHVKKDNRHGKVWLEPVVELEYSQHYRPHQVNEILRLVRRHRETLLEAWNEFFGG